MESSLLREDFVKIEVVDDNTDSCEFTSTHAVSSVEFALKGPSPIKCYEEPCKGCKKEEIESRTGKVSLIRSASEDPNFEREETSNKQIPPHGKQTRCDFGKHNDVQKIFVVQQANRGICREDVPTLVCIQGRIMEATGVKRKIPRPANAFMLFANKWRKKLAAENPRESNKDISVRLGILWKNMTKDVKEKYFALAREVDAEHKRKYPDYVYNPKEARLRKAMREQSRELSRRSILQNAIARTGGIASTSAPVSVSGFLDHHFNCILPSAGTGSPLPISSNVEPDRAAEPPWFHAHRTKPIHSPRIPVDWYTAVPNDPIERLQAMGTLHQAALDKSCKDVLRNQSTPIREPVAQIAECGTAFSNGTGYPGNFAALDRNRELHRQESMPEYGDFPDGQKWHPYQNGPGLHQHPRISHPQQIPNILHPNVQSASSHGHGRGPWSQFCHGILPNVPTMFRNVGIRGPRHAVFFRDRMPNRHSNFPEENSRIPYTSSKLGIDSVHPPYSPAEHQMSRHMEPSLDTVIDSANTRTHQEEEDEENRWESNAVSTGISLDNIVSTSATQMQEPGLPCDKEYNSRQSLERVEVKKKMVSKQPLPGFHQAFGSTEIGKFSRSEFFVNMVGESGGNVDVRDGQNDVSRDRIEVNRIVPVAGSGATGVATSAAPSATAANVKTFEADENGEQSFEDSHNEIVGPSSSASPYCGQANVPRWHSPHVGAIGSEI